MAVSINSQEFANALRIVLEALLAYLQSGGTIGSTPSEPEDSGGKKTPQDGPVEPKVEEKPVQDERYAACPISQDDGSYIFKNLKDSMQEESMYKITRYKDGSCVFELCDLKGEQRQWFKDNRTNLMPEKVGIAIGEITIDNTITTTAKGQGKMDGRIVIITKPLRVEFKNS